MFCDMGRFANAAKLEKEIAEMYEANNESEKCVKHYQKAADYFLGEDSTAAANQCLLKVAHFNALLEKYDDAVKIYEDVAQACLEKNVLKFNAKGHLFCAGILHLVRGVRFELAESLLFQTLLQMSELLSHQIFHILLFLNFTLFVHDF